MLLHVAAGLVLCLLTWIALRLMVGAPLLGRRGPGRLLPLFLDLLPEMIGFALFLLVTARPIMAGLGIVTLGIGLAIADRVKRKILGEPVLFADRAELIEVVRHPKLYLSFVGLVPMVLATFACAAVVAAFLMIEPPLWHAGVPAVVAAAIVAIVIGRASFVVPALPLFLGRLARRYERLAITRDPAEDARRFGLLAACIIQATLASHERPARQQAAQARAWPSLPDDAGPIVIVQGESFIDATRLHAAFADLLPHFARLKEEAVVRGRLDVPCWGANTIRTELAVLAGLGPNEVGLDRYNPYEHFAQVPLPSLASVARAAGYRTICLHPYTANFYARDKVMPLLGFDEFIAIDAFTDAPRVGPYVSDVAVAERAAQLVRAHGPRVLIFIITMQNHGPWDAAHDAVEPVALPLEWQAFADPTAVGRWLAHLRATDAMIPILRDAIGAAGWLVFYGDHQPSLAGPFHVPGAPDQRSDYAIWRPGMAGGVRSDLAAEQIAFTLFGCMKQ
ncbi:LTA synthase family protein [Sphingomonas nostoxanthinifaciens]|uniref:LTA synthase family protein n=1 Tax=Sphingomonas nostoxanthinifaciens TaxID=2872652 RepID=UPI001CC2142C|nr:LTA synthase family protein [Sphingomonas nostoxanthinifaciens]UAK25010.1 LTA synthase family protein [Sphingomonas nostoxanthinifaciens]